jgi:hypothetical protein
MLRPTTARGGGRAAVIPEPEVGAVGQRVGKRVRHELGRVSLRRRPLQGKALGRSRGYRPIDVEPRKGVPDQPHRRDAPGCGQAG